MVVVETPKNKEKKIDLFGMMSSAVKKNLGIEDDIVPKSKKKKTKNGTKKS